MASCSTRSRTHTLALYALATLSALLTSVALAAPPAQAAVTHEFLGQITEGAPAEGPKGEPIALPGPLGEIRAMTIDGGDLYLAESISGGSRVDVYDTATRKFVRQFDQSPSIEGTYLGVAVGHATGDTQVYVGAVERKRGEPFGVVAPFDSEGHPIGHPWAGEDTPNGAFSGHEAADPTGFEQLEGEIQDIAVDNDTTTLLGDWAAGDVFIDTATKYFGAFPAVNVVDIFKSEADGAEKYQTQLTGTCESPGTCPGKVVPFNHPTKVAVDPRNGNLLVVDSEKENSKSKVVDMFRPSPIVGEYEFVASMTGSPEGSFQEIEDVAVDGGTGDIYVAESSVIYQFSSAGAYLGHLTETPARSFASVQSMAVDSATGDLYISDSELVSSVKATSVDVFGPGFVVPDVTTGNILNVKPASATLTGTVNPDEAGEATCQFVWGTSEAFGHVAPCSAAVAEGEAPVPVSATIEGLQPDTTYYYRLQATNAHGANQGEASQNMHFTTSGPGLQASASSISSTSASLDATINPNNASTTYYFQYGTTTGYGAEVPVAPGETIDSEAMDVEVTRHIQGLLPQTLYHYRVVGVSDLEVTAGVFQAVTFDGSDQTFTTQATGGKLVLPDGRAWEQVSPSDKHGSVMVPIAESNLIQSSMSGDAITYVGTGPTEADASGYAESVQVFSKRGPGGWSSQDISLPHGTASGVPVGVGREDRFFSEDLSLGLAEPYGEFTSLAPDVFPQDTERTLYLRHDETCVTEPSSCYKPLVTGAPGYANVPVGTKFGGANLVAGNLQFRGGTPDLSHVVLASKVALTPTPIEEPSLASPELYEWAGGRLQLVSVLPKSEGASPAAGAEFGERNNARHAISEDGSRIVWSTGSNEDAQPNGLGGHLYISDTTTPETATTQLDVAQAGAKDGNGEVRFATANDNDSRVFFTDTRQLTLDSGAFSGAGEVAEFESDLYECEMQKVAEMLKCKLTDLTPGTSSQRANVQGVVGASEDGAYIYFVADGVQGDGQESGAKPGNCRRLNSGAGEGTCNLYVRHDGATKFVAAMSGGDYPDWLLDEGSGLGRLTARVSPDGEWLAFMSSRSLTGYDNEDVTSRKPGERMDEEVYLYNAATSHISCASCNPTGARPAGVEYAHLSGGLAGGNKVWGNEAWIAANIPGWTPISVTQAAYQSRYLSDSGRLFFNSSDALVPQDVNNNEDVYEYEPPGVGSCSTSSPTFSTSSGGCVGLISSGTAVGESAFLDASQSGGDVFFLTVEPLVSQDSDTALDVYDAHECTTQAPCTSSPVAPLPCTTADACRSAPSPQPSIFGLPGSATFSGPGTLPQPVLGSAVRPRALTRAQKLAQALKACHKKRARGKRAACERQAKKRFGAKQPRRVNSTKKGNR